MHGTLAEAPFQRGSVSFVRRESRLGPQVQRDWDEHYETLVIDVPRAQASMSVAPGFEFDAAREFGREAPLVVEIGSGTGDAVVQGALSRPGTNFLAVEVYGTGLAATVTKILHHNLTNVRLVHADAVQVLKHMLRPQSVAELWIFFADPWHKQRHHKRRLVTPAFADLVASRLAPGATLRLATDWANYALQMRDVLAACDSLSNPYDGELAAGQGAQALSALSANGPRGGFAPRFEGRVMTRFEEKGLASGRAIYDLELRRS
jgi:tRNA (guanine-N7-)-methyltransferase